MSIGFEGVLPSASYHSSSSSLLIEKDLKKLTIFDLISSSDTSVRFSDEFGFFSAVVKVCV